MNYKMTKSVLRFLHMNPWGEIRRARLNGTSFPVGSCRIARSYDFSDNVRILLRLDRITSEIARFVRPKSGKAF